MAPKSQQNAYVLGVGLTKFLKPRGERTYVEMGYEAGVKALLDAKINYDGQFLTAKPFHACPGSDEQLASIILTS
jgi:hypothetical protein